MARTGRKPRPRYRFSGLRGIVERSPHSSGEHAGRPMTAMALVPRTRSSHDFAASAFANFGFKAALET
jgi:hypothetical protein